MNVGNKKRYGSSCLSVGDNHTTNFPEAPYEAQVTPSRNPCIGYYQQIFRQFPADCSVNGDSTKALIWMDSGVTTRPLSDRERERLETFKEKVGYVTNRPYKKKKPCNTKK